MLHSRPRGDRRHGQMLVLFALVLVVILAFAAIVIDLGVLRNNRQILANTMDAAALAGGTQLPVDGSVLPVGSKASQANDLINQTIQADYPGLPSSAYSISYKCLIGVTVGNQPNVSRDVPWVCNPATSLGWTVSTTLATKQAAFKGAGPTRVSTCNPSVGDLCNSVQVSGSATTPFSLGPVVGVSNGSTGVVGSASCSGPCGASPVLPVDVVLIMDRTQSMSGDGPGTDIAAIQSGASTVLSVFNPTIQRVALGTIGPSINGNGSCPNQSSAWKNTQVLATGQSNVNDYATVGKWVPVGFVGTDSGSPAVLYNEAYSFNGVVNISPALHIWPAISCLSSFSAGHEPRHAGLVGTVVPRHVRPSRRQEGHHPRDGRHASGRRW